MTHKRDQGGDQGGDHERTRAGLVNEYPIPDEGLNHALDILVRAALVSDEPLEMRLYVNDLIPQRTTVFADYTEASFGGYSRRVLNRSDWAAAVVDQDHAARIRLTAGPQIYTPTVSDVTVYGCYLLLVSAGVVQYARRFATPRVTVAGVSFAVNPIITARSELVVG